MSVDPTMSASVPATTTRQGLVHGSVTVGSALYAGTLTPACDAAADYLSMWQYNFVELIKAMSR